MLLSGGINKAVSFLIIAGLLFALTAPGSAGTAASTGGGSEASLLRGAGGRLYICLPKETVTEAGGEKLFTNSTLWVRSYMWLVLQSVTVLDIAFCPIICRSGKIVEVTHKKDGKK